jgi:hypothetical protein
MELNDIAIGTIQSEHLKEHLKKEKKIFTPEEQVTIIYNSDLTIDEKEDILIKYLCNGEVEDWFDSDDEVNDFRIKVNKIIKSIYLFRNLINMDSTVIMFDDALQYNKSCAKDLSVIKEKYRIAKEKDDRLVDLDTQITLIHIDTAAILAWAEINESGDVIRYDFVRENIESLITPGCMEKVTSGLEDKYVNIPNDFNVGDIVTICNDITHKRYIVVADSKLPEQLQKSSDYSVDASVMIIPEECLTNDKRYKEQIDNIIKERIEKLNNGEQDIDVITKEHEHVHVTLLEKE